MKLGSPGAFALLRLLVERAGRFVARDELLAADWPGLHVNGDAAPRSSSPSPGPGRLMVVVLPFEDIGATAAYTVLRPGSTLSSHWKRDAP